MKQDDDEKPKELSLGMITRGRHANRWLKLAALSFAVTGCDAFIEAKTSKDTAGLEYAENPTPDAENPTPDAENPENPTPDAENPENPTPDAENPTPDAENPTPDAENPENPENPTMDAGIPQSPMPPYPMPARVKSS